MDNGPEKTRPSEEPAAPAGGVNDVKNSIEATNALRKAASVLIDTISPQIEEASKVDINTLPEEQRSVVSEKLGILSQKMKLLRDMADKAGVKIDDQMKRFTDLEGVLHQREAEIKTLMEESDRQKQVENKVSGKPNTSPKATEKSPEVVSSAIKVPNTNPPSKLSLYDKDQRLIGTFTIVGNGQVSEWDLRLNGRDYGQAVWNGSEWDCSIDATFSAYAKVNNGALVAVAAPTATPAVKPEAQPIQSAAKPEPVKPKEQVTPKVPAKETTPAPKSSPKPEVAQPTKTPEKQPEVTLPRMKFPERLDDSAKPTIANDQVAYDKWDNEWLLDTNENSVYSRIVKRYKELKSIKSTNPDNALAQESYVTVIALVRAFDTIIQKGGDSADFQNMRDTEQILMQLDEALYTFEAASAKKKVQKTPRVSVYDQDNELGNLLKRKTFKSVVDSHIEEEPVEAEAQSESVESARTVTLPRNAPFQIEVRDAQARTTYTLDSISQNTTRATKGPVQIVGGQTEWTLAVPPTFSGTMRIIQNGVEKSYTYGMNGASAVEKPAVAPIKPAATPEARTTPQSKPAASPEKPIVQPTLSRSSIAEYFQQPGGLNRLTERIQAQMNKYDVVKNDKGRFGGHIEWQTYMGECRQLYVRYLLALPNGTWPTDQNNQIALLSALEEFEQALQNYELESKGWRDNPPEKEEPVWNDNEAEKLPWRSRVENATKIYREMKGEYVAIDAEPVKELMEKLSGVMMQYSSVYYEQTKPGKSWDEQAIAANVTQMERTIHYYKEKLADAKADAERPATPASTNTFFNLIDSAKSVVDKVVKQGKEDPEMEKRVLDGMFQKGQPRNEIRKNLIYGSTLKPFPKLSNQEIQSLLWMKAHLKEFAGTDGRLNARDADAIINSLYTDVLPKDDVLSLPLDKKQALYYNIMGKKKFARGSENDIGLQKVLGLIAPMTADEANGYNTGVNYENKAYGPPGFLGIKRLIGNYAVKKMQKTPHAAKPWMTQYQALQDGKAGLSRMYKERASIPIEVRQAITEEIHGFLQKSHIPVHTKDKEAGMRRLTKAQMEEFQKHALVLKEVSQRSLKHVVDRTGASIETYLPDGLTVEFIDWILDSHARPDGRKGSAPGSNFWIEGAGIPRAIDPKKVKEPVASKAVDIEEPKVELGESSSDSGLGTPVDIKEIK